MGNFSHYVVFILTAIFGLGVLVQLSKNPAAANQLFAAGADTVNGISHAVEGRS